MPLQLGGVETERGQTVLWNPDAWQEVIDAIDRINKLKDDGFALVSLTRGEARLVPPELDPNQSVIRILSQNGDDRLIWDRSRKDEVKEAFDKFNELLKKGYTAYILNSKGERGHKITEFDPGLEEVVFAQIKEAVLVPRVVPG